MANIRPPVPVKPICGLLYSPGVPLETIRSKIESILGSVEDQSSAFQFTFTEYYAEEMGGQLEKLFMSFSGFVQATELVRFKIATNRLEDEWKQADRRRINVDPGYLTAAKVVLATTKDYTHRIHLADGIYGDVQLGFIRGTFQPNPWTYPDYRTESAVAFFNRVKNRYMEQTHHDKTDHLSIGGR